MASEESVTEHFSMLGVEVEGAVLRKCVDLCISNRLDPETFAEQWMAFSLSHHNGVAPTVDLLEIMERKEFSKKNVDTTYKDLKDFPVTNESNLSVYDHPEHTNDGVLADYICTTPKSKKGNRDYLTPRSTNIKTEGTSMSLSPMTYSPSLSQSAKYSSRSNSGEILCSFGNEESLTSCIWVNTLEEACKIQQIPNHSESTLSSRAMYGFELLQEKANLLNQNIKYLSQHILSKAVITESSSVKCKSQAPVTIVGRVDCDANGRLNSKSVLLQGTWEESLGLSVPVDLDYLTQYSLFPGQIVAMKGLNLRGDKFSAHEIFYDASLIKPLKINPEESPNGSLQMVVACGPFTTSDSLTYDPLNDLILYITKHKPHAVILLGPFVDANHQSVKDDTIAETYKSFFEKLVDKIMNAVELSSPSTQIIMGSSSKDVFHSNIYPTPAFSIRKRYLNLLMVGDPCTLSIGGLTVGITTTDILMHLSKEEISLPAQGPDKLGRLAGHLLNQQSFYPLWPPPEFLPVDTALWSEHAPMAVTPRVLILPSNLRYFAKDINGCLVINPERLTKGIGGGTFARIQMNAYTPSQDILCQVIRV